MAEEDMSDKSESEMKQLELTDDPTWIIDPIDGTSNYVLRLPLSSISVALTISKKVELAIVSNPVTGHKYTARRGQGAFENGVPIKANVNREELKLSTVCFELFLIRIPWHKERNTNRFLALTHRSNGVRDICSAAITISFVAKGALDVYFSEHLKPWDVAAGSLILQEAGGYVCDTEGGDFDLIKGKILVASSKKLAEEVLGIFKEFP